MGRMFRGKNYSGRNLDGSLNQKTHESQQLLSIFFSIATLKKRKRKKKIFAPHCLHFLFLRSQVNPVSLDFHTHHSTEANVLSAQLCLTLCDPMDCSPPDSSVPGTSQVRILAWVDISSSRGVSQPRNWTCIFCVSCIGRRILYHWAT